MERYVIETLRSGQPRPYADTEREYHIKVERMAEYGQNKGQWEPWLRYGEVEAQIVRESKARAEGKLSGGYSPEQLRKQARDWALKIVRALCQNFREKGDDDGMVEGTMEAHFFPTLKSLKIDGKAGTITAFIIEPFTD